MKSSRRYAALCAITLSFFAGCGGGGGGDNVATPAPGPAPAPTPGTLTTYGTTNLPGRLVVQATDGPSFAYDLRTGQGAPLPMSTLGPGNNDWYGNTSKNVLLRVLRQGIDTTKTVEAVRTSDWSVLNEPLTVTGTSTRVKLSPSGKYLLTFWQPGNSSDERELTIFEVATGNLVKRGSALNGRIVTGGPAAWLPDDRYVYLAGRKLYRSSPTQAADEEIATLSALPDNSLSQNNIDVLSTGTELNVSPDGTKIAFDWRTVRRNVTGDRNIWVVNTDGTGLRQLTAPVDPSSPLEYPYGNPTWSPDSQWVAGVLYMNGGVVAPIFPPDQSFPGVPGGIIGSTGCGGNPVFVLPATAEKVALSWPTHDVRYGLKVLNREGNGGLWVTACSTIQWVE